MVSRLKSLFCVLLCVFIAAGFFSCDALDSPDDSSFGATCEIKGTFLTEDVFPADLTAPRNGTGLSESARSASPGINGSVYYTVEAVNIENSSLKYKGSVSGNSFSIKVSKGRWKVFAEGFSDEGKSVAILKGNSDVSVDDDYSVKSGIEMALSPLTDGKGDILLEIQKATDSGIKSFCARLEKLGGEPVSPESIEINFLPGSDSANFEKDKIASGTYILSLEFYSETECTGNLLYYARETVNVFKNLTTDTWRGNSSYLTGGKFSVTKEIVETFLMKSFFVQGSDASYTPRVPADDTNSGTYFEPLRTIQATVNKIESINDGTSSYTVMVDGKFVAAFESSALVEIQPSKNLTLTIGSFSPDSAAVLDLKQLGRGFYIGEKASVTFKNMKISNGWLKYITGEDGSGIYCEGNLSLQNCSFRDNSTKHGSGAIYFSGETLEVSDCEFIGNKGGDLSGGIYCDGNASFKNCTFNNNTGRLGGAIIFLEGTHSVSDCKFIGNEVAASNGSDRVAGLERYNGSAICCFSSGELTLSGCEFKENSSEEGSVVDFYYGNCTVTIESGIFSGNKSTGSIDRGAIYVGTGKLRLGGSVTIEDEKSKGICLVDGQTIEIVSELSPKDSAYTASLVFETYEEDRKVFAGADGYTVTKNDYEKFTVFNEDEEIRYFINQDGCLAK